MNFAKIILQQKTGTTDNLLTYSIPTHLKLEIGQLVIIPFRKKIVTGLVWELTDKKPDFKTLEIMDLTDKKPLLNSHQIQLINWMSKYYFCSPDKILKLFIPKRVFNAKPIKFKIVEPIQIEKPSPKELTEEQKKTLETIKNTKSNTFLIHGITGSGKTEIYVRLAEETIKNDKQALILVPEISLTPQTIEYFEKSLGFQATVIHSKISEGERYKSWKSIWDGESRLIIGSRSAIFSPFHSLGLIIIDEEHESSYKQEQSPRYTTNKIAEKIQEFDPKLKLIFGSATPSIETHERLKESLISLKNRVGGTAMPEIEIVDLREEFKKQNYSIFSDTLKQELAQTIADNSQAILFLNRRGSASSIVCRDCGYTEQCNHCELPLTYHTKTLNSPSLICHHCGKIFTTPLVCRNCNGTHIRFLGIGTQKIETELLKEFPHIRVLRADKDSTSKKQSFEKIYKAFRNHQADVLIGTQMIAKGLHLPKVNLVGVVLADIGLTIPDFRTAERNFQLMTQVAGRAGRTNDFGKVIIQTYNPEHIALLCAKNYDYDQFLNYERTQRKILANPPFSKLAKLVIENKSLQQAKNLTSKIENLLQTNAKNFLEENLLEINSYPAYINKLRGKYRHIILIKDKSENNIIHNLLEKLPKEYIIDPNIKIDIDPIIIT